MRILIPNHPKLEGLAERAYRFIADLKSTADPTGYPPGEGPWRMPTELVDGHLERAWDAVFEPWVYQLGTQWPGWPLLEPRSAERRHLPAWVLTAPEDDIERLRRARDTLVGHARREIAQPNVDLCDFLDEVVKIEQTDGRWTFTAFCRLVELLDVAVADAPIARPGRTIDHSHAPSADAELILNLVDDTPCGPVRLTADQATAYRRLLVEWHHAIYQEKANSALARLGLFLYWGEDS